MAYIMLSGISKRSVYTELLIQDCKQITDSTVELKFTVFVTRKIKIKNLRTK